MQDKAFHSVDLSHFSCNGEFLGQEITREEIQKHKAYCQLLLSDIEEYKQRIREHEESYLKLKAEIGEIINLVLHKNSFWYQLKKWWFKPCLRKN